MSARGQKRDVPRRVFADARAGREVWAVSPEGVNSGASYMYVRQFTPDERYLFYESEISGSLQLHRYELATGVLTQVSDAAAFGLLRYHVHPGGKEVFYAADGSLWAAHVETLETRRVMDSAAHPWLQNLGGLVMLSRSGRWISFHYRTLDDLSGIGRVSSDGREVQSLHARPKGEGTQHLMFCNAEDEDLMSFSPAPDHQQQWDAPREFRPRTYLMHVGAGTVEPFLIQPKPFTTTHDYWSPNGDRLYFHKKTRPAWVPTWICSIERGTRREREIYRHDRLKLGHSYCSADEKWIVSDVQEAGNNPLILIDVATGKDTTLCWPDSSVAAGRDAYSHVHPSFSPSGRFVLYTSDVSGVGQVYIVPVRG